MFFFLVAGLIPVSLYGSVKCGEVVAHVPVHEAGSDSGGIATDVIQRVEQASMVEYDAYTQWRDGIIVDLFTQ